MTGSTAVDALLAECVGGYSERIRRDVLVQHERESVSSPLGIWLLLCACLQGAEGSERGQLESIIGCSREDAGECLDAFLSNLPAALHAAVALWVREALVSERIARWRSELPSQIERGPIPTQEQADAWADRNTLGLIKRFPIEPAEFDLVVASALATNVSWEHPFDVAVARDRFSPSSPWIGSERSWWPLRVRPKPVPTLLETPGRREAARRSARRSCAYRTCCRPDSCCFRRATSRRRSVRLNELDPLASWECRFELDAHGISQAIEDKPLVAAPLAHYFRSVGFKIWYDDFSLRVGDSILGEINRGLSESDYGIVILSPAFFAKPWPKRELAGLIATAGEGRVLPVWHQVTAADVARASPILADIKAVSTGLSADPKA